MNRVDGLNSTGGPASPRQRRQSLGLGDRECIHPTEVFSVLNSLSSTVIFNSATDEERLALAKRLRYWAVEDGTYLIREGDGDTRCSAVFIIASGKATVSLNRTLPDGSVQEVDVKDIKCPNYFGEGRVLGDECAYASVRAKDRLVVYYLMRADIRQFLSKRTQALMLRDMEIRKFQKENMNDLFAVVRDRPSGMRYLTRFAQEQLMDLDVVFFNDVQEYRSLAINSIAQRKRAWHIYDRYIWPSDDGAGSIYTSDAQRKSLVAKMVKLWGDRWSGEASGEPSRDDDLPPRRSVKLATGAREAKGGTEEVDGELSRTLFDEILDQNAVPTIRQDIIPKFIQSAYYEEFLNERFPLLGEAGEPGDADESSKDGNESTRCVERTAGKGETRRHSAEAVVSGAASVAGGAASSSPVRVSTAQGTRSRHSWSGSPRSRRISYMQGSQDFVRTAARTKVQEIAEQNVDFGAQGLDKMKWDGSGDDGGSSDDEFLESPGLERHGISWSLSKAKFAAVQATKDACGMM